MNRLTTWSILEYGILIRCVYNYHYLLFSWPHKFLVVWNASQFKALVWCLCITVRDVLRTSRPTGNADKVVPVSPPTTSARKYVPPYQPHSRAGLRSTIETSSDLESREKTKVNAGRKEILQQSEPRYSVKYVSRFTFTPQKNHNNNNVLL